MGSFLKHDTQEYYEGDKADWRDQEVNRRPSPDYVRVDGEWVIDPAKLRQRAIVTIQTILDAKAREYGHDDIHTAGNWKDSKDATIANNARALYDWADNVWIFARQEWARQEAGIPTFTTLEAFLAALPTFVPPA